MSELLNFVLAHPQFREARLPSLYSDFSHLGTLNPTGFTANTLAWTTVLSSSLAAGHFPDRLILPVSQLTTLLSHPTFGRPLALGIALAEAQHAGTLYPLAPFLSSPTSIYHWTYLGSLFSWGLTKTGLRGPPTKPITEGRWVMIECVEKAAEIVAEAMRGRDRVDRVMTVDLFREEVASDLSVDDVRVLLKFMSRDKGMAAWDDQKGVVVFGETVVGESDVAVAGLKGTLLGIRRRVEELEEDVEKCTETAKQAVDRANKVKAMAALRSRKTVERALEEKTKAMVTVEDVLAGLRSAQDNVELVEVLERSGKAMAGLNKELGGVERVDRVMEGLREERENVEEVNRVLAQAGDTVDEESVEEELEAMLEDVKEEEAAEKRRKALEEMPSVPKKPTKERDLERELSDSLEGMTLGSLKVEEKAEEEAEPEKEKEQGQEREKEYA
ncbi:Snf7-domain-containing protein [Pyronema domesticum]|nr:Snf7-domain-containing protein [Pyronema domesticum]